MNRVRIISGKFKGRKITTPGGATHPMGERERLALFNMISEYLPGAMVLDAYAGSGALGIEALSRGALEAVFVEKSGRAYQVIQENLRDLGINGEVVSSDIKNFVTDQKFDVILADPPYDKFVLDEVEDLAKFLNKGGILVLSHPGDEVDLPGLELKKSHKYAAARISTFIKG